MADVLILGGGIIGCAVADELTHRGADVVVVDPRGVGLGASQASAGMLAPYTEGRHDPVMQSLGVRSLNLYDALIDRLRSDGCEVGYTRRGSVEVAVDADGAARLADDAAALARDGIAHRLLTGEDTRRALPALASDVTASLEVAAHGCVNVSALVAALWQTAERRRARLLHRAALRVSPGHGTVRVETSEGPIDAAHVVLAAGCWAGRIDLAGGPTLPVRPVRGQLLVLGLPASPATQALWGPGCYLVPWDDGTVLVGATVEDAGFDEHATVEGVATLLAAAPAVLPSLARAAFSAVRVGLRPGTPDDRPIIGRSTRVEGLVYATGHYRNGALLAPVTAQLVADAVEGRAHHGDALDEFSPTRFGEY